MKIWRPEEDGGSSRQTSSFIGEGQMLCRAEAPAFPNPFLKIRGLLEALTFLLFK